MILIILYVIFGSEHFVWQILLFYIMAWIVMWVFISFVVTKLLHLPEPPKPDDTADALAIAICTTYCMNNAVWRNQLS